MNRTQVMERISPMTDLKLRVIDGQHAKVGINDEVVVLRPGSGSKLIPFTHDGVESLGKFVGFPVSTTQKLSKPTASNVMTELLRRKEKFSIFTRDGEVVSVFRSQQWHQLKVERMLSVLEQTIQLQDYNRVFELEKHVARIEMVGERREVIAGSALKNDVVAGGIVVNFSPIGTIAPSIESYVLRVNCTNGATTPEVAGFYEYPSGGGGEGDDIWQWFRANSRKAYNSVTKIARHFERMAEEPISPEDRAAILDSMLINAGMRGDVAGAVRAEALTHPPTNAWEMMNLITWGSSHILSEPKEVVRAQKSVKDFISATTHQRTCPMCHQSKGGHTLQLTNGDPTNN